MAQSQASLEDQLNELEALAAKHGLYDAQDWLRRVRAEGTRLQRSFRVIEEDEPEYNWCRVCDSDWDTGAPENHRQDCPIHE